MWGMNIRYEVFKSTYDSQNDDQTALMEHIKY